MKPITVVEFVKPAEDYEEEMDATFSESAPKGKFSRSVLNSLVAAYREAQQLMGFEEADLYPEFSEPVVTEFPPQFVRGLAMLAKAAEDYGQPGVIDLSQISRDADVALLASKIEKLVNDEGFAAFLAEAEAENEDEGGMPSAGGPPPKSEDEAMDELFAQRAK